ncbi:B12-binding domain-containing radical SAM protein [Candidatus Chloroploca sp. Khr17]|uniref:B12-binding domain-containing radical SAM protein n=1 Tax=Candidatus Chloroploca sp. Khr17 TaxID=2496869 RepID=UPI00101D32A9|nr:radical SAM protein [Candidatus Chloroploca sp. Khr17]
MHIVLISPYSRIEAIGLRVLSSCLKAAGATTSMIFLPNLEEAMAGDHFHVRNVEPALVQQMTSICANADLVAISVMTPSFHKARVLTQAIKTNLSIPVIWGGIHPTVRPDECLQYADLVCIGEGEQAIVELVQALAEGRSYKTIRNLGYLDQDGQLVLNPLRPLITNLDALPFPDYAFEDHYLLHEGTLTHATERLMAYYMTDVGSWAVGPVYGVLTMRGCPYHCTFCANNALMDIYEHWSHLRRRSPASVIAEIQAVRERLPQIEAIILHDDTFLANATDYIAKFSRLYREAVGLPFRAYTTAQTVDPVKLQYLTEAGLRYVIMGIQSGSRRIQKLYERKVTNERVLQAAREIHRFQAWVPRPNYDLITDNPYETLEDRWATLQLINQIPPPYRLALHALTFYPGTDLYHRAIVDGYITPDDQRSYAYNFQIIASTYYNFALFCHSLNLPQPFLRVLATYLVFRIMSLEPMDRLAGRLLDGLLALRLWRNTRLYARRHMAWIESEASET